MSAVGRKKSTLVLFLAPSMGVLLLLLLLPVVLGMGLSLLESNKSTLEQSFSAPYVGFSNYREAFWSVDTTARRGLWDAVRNSVIYTVCVTAGTILLGMAGALLVHRNFRGRTVARTLLLFSWIVPSYVAGMLWGFMWQQDEGIINTLLFDVIHFDVLSGWLGVHWDYALTGELVKPRWLTGENTIWAIIVPTVWRFWPFAMIMFLAGLSSIPRETYEAAEMDGASKAEQFFYVTLPILRPVWILIILQSMVVNVYSFNLVIMMFGNGAGFPGKHGDLLMTYVFRTTFQMWNFGMGAALSSMLMGLMVVVIFLWYRSFRGDIQNG
jgi:multiple sugar transport system permease protein